MQVDDLVEFLQRYGLTNDQYAELEEILSKKLDAALKHRLLTFFKGVRKGASSDNVEAALVSIKNNYFFFEGCFLFFLSFPFFISFDLNLFRFIYMVIHKPQ